MDVVDVVVVGGRVSGAPLAMLLARKGHKVMLLEKQVFPKDVLSTHFIWPRGMSYLQRWGLAERVLAKTPHGTVVELNMEGAKLKGTVPARFLKDRFQQLHGDSLNVIETWSGPRRYFLDQILLDGAKEAGVDVREGVSFTNVLAENGTVTGVTAASATGTPFDVKATLVVGADGRFSNVAKKVGAKPLTVRERSSFAYYSYFPGLNGVGQSVSRRGRLGAAVFPTNDGAHMGLVYGPSTWWDDFRADPENNFFKAFDFCSPENGEALRGSKREDTFKACATMPAFLRQQFGPGWALAGDAGAFHDQVTAMGMTHAFRDSELLAAAIHQSLAGELPMMESLTRYDQKRTADHNEYFEVVCKIAEMNVFSKAEVQYFRDIQGNQEQIDELLARFSDTLPMSKESRALHGGASTSPQSIADFVAALPSYEANLFRN